MVRNRFFTHREPGRKNRGLIGQRCGWRNRRWTAAGVYPDQQANPTKAPRPDRLANQMREQKMDYVRVDRPYTQANRPWIEKARKTRESKTVKERERVNRKQSCILTSLWRYCCRCTWRTTCHWTVLSGVSLYQYLLEPLIHVNRCILQSCGYSIIVNYS